MSTLYQYNTLGALMLGQFDGDLTVGTFKKKGTLGIGTFNQMDGELILLGDTIYKVDHSGEISEVSDQQKIPYGACVDFQASRRVSINKPWTFHGIEEHESKLIPTNHNFYAFKITGTFKSVKCRSGKKQEKPYPKFIEATEEQNEFTAQHVKGTALGFYTPALFGRISANGFHIHFLSEDKTFGGHVMDFEIEAGQMEMQEIYHIHQELPRESLDFSGVDGHQLLDEIDQAEK